MAALAPTGASETDIVATGVFLADGDDFDEMNTVYRESLHRALACPHHCRRWAATRRPVRDQRHRRGTREELGDLACIDDKVTHIEQHLAGIDVLVRITGGPPPTTVRGQSEDLWSKHFRSMVLSVIAITDRVLPGMSERRWGRLITSASSGVIAPIPNLGLSNALRSSLVGWNKTLAGEVGVTANIVVPGRIATGRITQFDEAKAAREGRTVDEVAAASVASIPMGRYGQPEEYADMVAFLASERAGHVTASVIRVDGGLIPSV